MLTPHWLPPSLKRWARRPCWDTKESPAREWNSHQAGLKSHLPSRHQGTSWDISKGKLLSGGGGGVPGHGQTPQGLLCAIHHTSHFPSHGAPPETTRNIP